MGVTYRHTQAKQTFTDVKHMILRWSVVRTGGCDLLNKAVRLLIHKLKFPKAERSKHVLTKLTVHSTLALICLLVSNVTHTHKTRTY